MLRDVLLSCFLLLTALTFAADPTATQRVYLSGHGPSDAVEWDFKVSAGRRAGEWAKIPVPSHWEQHGFGDYDYGTVAVKEKHKEDGLYRHEFAVPAAWQDRHVRIVFEGSMTDTTVKINGEPAGPTHQGGFYRFHHNITDMIRFGATNQLEVLVSKDSANGLLEQAERKSDYWVFGGIFRPVWLEARPAQFIEWVATDARADGSLRVEVHPGNAPGVDKVTARVTKLDGSPVGDPFSTIQPAAWPAVLTAKLADIRPWSAESPTLYQLEIALLQGEEVVHQVRERIGFRTLEVRPGEGVFVNGSRIVFKGIDRHCFRPESGRALDRDDSYEDVRLLQEMNMNAVRCSHYPPDKHFLEACDELGLWVIDELCTWQKPAIDTPTARRLVGQLVRRDVNHPSILFWANGNEGGWNTEIDGDYAKWDPQGRPVLHPWDPFSGFQTKHYPDWKRLQQDLSGDLLVMPTELLHGLFDGGHGAGLDDYWNAITSRPNGVGGFLWVMADEGIMRSDRDGAIDNWGINAPDGIVGPRHEKEASFFTAKDIFCPVQIAMKRLPAEFDGRIEVVNRYNHRDLSTVNFEWKLSGEPNDGGKLAGPAARPGRTATLGLPLPPNWRAADMLSLGATDSDGRELWTWCWPTHAAGERTISERSGTFIKISEDPAGPRSAEVGNLRYQFDRDSGRLMLASIGSRSLPLGNGPRLVGVTHRSPTPLKPAKIAKAHGASFEKPNKPANAIDGDSNTRWSGQGRDQWLELELAAPTRIDSIAIAWQKGTERRARFALDLSDDGQDWTEVLRGESRPEADRLDIHHFAARTAGFARLRCFGNSRNDWNSILELQLGTRKPDGGTTARTVKQRRDGECLVIESTGDGPFESFTWTVHPCGRLELAYRYRIDQAAPFHGVTFDLPEEDMHSLRWRGQGPRRAWRNRMRGLRFGDFENLANALTPGHDFDYPHFRGYYAAIHQARLLTDSGYLTVIPHQDDTFLRVGTNDEGERIRTYWPEGDLSILHAIPAIGTKFKPPESLGPQSQLNPAPGVVEGKVSFRCE